MMATGWYGVLWLLFSALIIYEILRPFIKVKPAIAGGTIVAIVGVIVVYSIINAQFIRIKTLTIPGPENIDIVQLSDIHVGSVSVKYMARLIDKTNALNPDMVLITGDLVDNFNPTIQKGISLLKNLNVPVLFVTGNHEQYAGRSKIIRSLRAENVKVLENQIFDFGQIQIIGIDDTVRKNMLQQMMRQIKFDSSKYTILMYHRPFELKDEPLDGIDLLLCGHTHGGQIFPFNFIVEIFYRPLSGLHKLDSTYQYVTTGCGTWGPRMRFGSRSEIVLIKIKNNIP